MTCITFFKPSWVIITIIAVFSIVAMEEDNECQFPSLSDLAARVVAKDCIDSHKKTPKNSSPEVAVLIKKYLPKELRDYPRLTRKNIIAQKREAYVFKDKERIEECLKFILNHGMPSKVRYYLYPKAFSKDFEKFFNPEEGSLKSEFDSEVTERRKQLEDANGCYRDTAFCCCASSCCMYIPVIFIMVYGLLIS